MESLNEGDSRMNRSRPSWREHRRNVVVLLCLCATPALNQNTAVTAAGREAAEYEVKAAYLLNFTKFVEWPRTQDDPAAETFSICILGDDPFGGTLDQLVRNEAVNGRPIAVRRIRRLEESCEVLFVSRSERDVFRVLSRVTKGVLTVGEEPGFLRDGGMINLLVEDRRVRFDVNLEKAESSSLRISSRLLGVARSVLR